MKTALLLPAFMAGALAASGCCHVNELAERAEPIESFALTLGDDPTITLRFTRGASLRTRQLIGPLARTHRSVLDYEGLLAELGGGRLREHLHQQISRVLIRQLGWRSGDEGGLLRVEVEELVFTAAGPNTPLNLSWRLRASLVDAADDSLIWRDCEGFDQSLGTVSMAQLNAMAPQVRERFVSDLARSLAEHLARRLSEDGAGRVGNLPH